jgi:type I restriction enzyme, S subunit
MSWQARKLGEFISIKHGWAFKGELFSDSGRYVLLTPGNAHETGGLKLRPGKEKFYLGDFPPDYLMKTGDMLVVMTDLIQAAPILGGAIVVPEDDRFLHNQRLGLVDFLPNTEMDKDFLYHLLNSPDYRAQVRGSATGATVRHTAPKRICDCTVLVPDTKEEQRQVAQVLSAYDDLIATNQRRIALLEDAARRLYREWFVHLRFPGHESVVVKDGVPEGWRKQTLASVADVNARSIGARDRPDSVLYIDISTVSTGLIGEVTPYAFADAPGRARRRVVHGDVIWSCVRPNRRSYALIWEPDERLVASTGFAVLSATGVPFSYLYFTTTTDAFVGHLEQNATGAAYPAVTAKTFEDAEILVPDGDTLAAFDHPVLPQLEQMEFMKQQNRALAQARDLLLPKLMSGQLDVFGIRLPEEATA